MLRRGSLAVLLTLSIAACGDNQNTPFAGAQTRPPSADAVLLFVSGSWSPDPGAPRELFALNADGSKLERLTSCAEAAQPCDLLQAAMAPDRNRVAAIRTIPNASADDTGLYYMDLSRAVEKLLFERRRVGSVDWSPNGTFLVYSSTAQGLTASEDLYYCLPNGTSDQALTSTTALRERSPRIDPGATTAVYEQIDEAGAGRVALYGGPLMLTTGPATGPALPDTPYLVGGDADPAFSPDAKRVVFRRLTGTGNGGLGTWDLKSVGSDGKDERPLAAGGSVFRGAPDWGKTGIVFVETDAALGKSRLVVVQPDGSGRKVLLEQSAGYRMGAPRWIPGS